MAPSPVRYIDKTTTAMAGRKGSKMKTSRPRQTRTSKAAAARDTGTVMVTPTRPPERSTRVPGVTQSPSRNACSNKKLALLHWSAAPSVGSPDPTIAIEASTTGAPQGRSSVTDAKGSSSKTLPPVEEEEAGVSGNLNKLKAKSDNDAEEKPGEQCP